MQARVAVLIDAENLSAACAKQVFDAVSAHGATTIRRAYGDFAGGCGIRWLGMVPLHAIDAVQVCSPTKGKNSGDMRMTIDAVELLIADRADTFCLVSGDADFTPLAVHLRGAGKRVIGIGGERASVSFRQSCTAFHVVSAPNKTPSQAVAKSPVRPASVHAGSDLLPLVQAAIGKLNGNGGWITLGRLGAALRVVDPGFQPKRYGSVSLKKVLLKEPALEIETREGSDFVRVRRGIALVSG